MYMNNQINEKPSTQAKRGGRGCIWQKQELVGNRQAGSMTYKAKQIDFSPDAWDNPNRMKTPGAYAGVMIVRNVFL
jgi:hypothetical protein